MSDTIDLAVSDKLVEATAVKNVQTVFHTLLKLNATASNYGKFFAALSANDVPIDALLADAKLDHVWSYDFVVSALKHGMSPDLQFNVDRLMISLPCYLVRSGHLSVLRKLLDDGVLTFSACAVTPEDMWEHLTVRKADIPVFCAVMEHFGDALNGLSSYNLVQWIESNRMLSGPLTVELSITPCPYPHLVRAVAEATPINSQAVVVAAKQGFVDWLEAEAGRLATVRPEGYKSWRALFDQLEASGVANIALLAVLTIVTLSEEAAVQTRPHIAQARRKAWPSLYLPAIGAEQVVEACTRLECVGNELQQYGKEIAAWVDKMDANARSALASELCGDAYPFTARAVAAACTAYGAFLPVAMHYKLTDLYPAFANGDTDGVIKHLCRISADAARAVVEKCTATGKLLAAAIHHRFTELYPDFLDSNADGVVNHLCSVDVKEARSLVEKRSEYPQLIRVAAYHDFADLLDAYIKRDPDSAVKHLSLCDPAHTRPIVERHINNYRFVRVATCHGFTDLVKGFITRKSYGCITSPAWTPTSPHRLSQDDATNAWLWLMIGDGDLDGKVWAAVNACELVDYDVHAATLIDGVLKSGRKVCRDVLTAMVKKYPYVLHQTASRCLDAVKCLVEAGADVNTGMRDSYGRTPLYFVKDAAIAQYLVESKADPSIRDNEGYTPLRYASKCNRRAVAAYLRSIGPPY